MGGIYDTPVSSVTTHGLTRHRDLPTLLQGCYCFTAQGIMLMGLGDGEGQGHGPGIRAFLLCGMDLCQVGREPPSRPMDLRNTDLLASLCAQHRYLHVPNLGPPAPTSAPTPTSETCPIRHKCCDTYTLEYGRTDTRPLPQ